MISRNHDVQSPMKLLTLPMIVGMLCGSYLHAVPSENSRASDLSQEQLKIESLLRGLADESFRVREDSTRELWEMGELVLPSLRDASSSTDPEQAIRSRDLMRMIELHITPDTDPSVITLVELYGTASAGEKAALMGRMRGKRAWRQMLKLYASETDAEVREKLQTTMRAVSIKAARERLMLKDAVGAREFLEMGPVDTQGLLALADFHRSHGSLQQELEKAAAGKDRRAAEWRMALQRTAGNSDAAQREATAAGKGEIAALMAALGGDPLPFLKQLGTRREEMPVSALYAGIAADRWQSKLPKPGSLEPLNRMLQSRHHDERGTSLNALLLLGEAQLAETALVKNQPLVAFRYFEALERIPEALSVLGLDPQAPDFNAWVEKAIGDLLTEDVAEQTEVSDHGQELVALANFLERRGLHAEAEQAYGDSLAAIAEKDSSAFVDFLDALFGGRDSTSGAPRLASKVGVAWAGNDEKRWYEVVVAAFGDDDRARYWWDWLAEIRPATDNRERLDAMLALFRMGTDPERLAEKWIGLIWQAVDAAPPAEREMLVAQIYQLAFDTGDVTTALRAWDELAPAARDQVFWGLQIFYLSAVERWDDAVDLILKQISAITEAGQEPPADLYAFAASALRAAGREKEAKENDQWAERLALGSAVISIRTGKGYAYGRDYQRAAEWWARAAMQADPDSEELIEAIKLHSDILLEQQKWPEAAATAEVIAAMYSGSEYQWSNQLPLLRQRLQADTTRALSHLTTDRAGSLALLEKCHRNSATDGSLADFFFPSVRVAGLTKEHDAWFSTTWEKIEEVIEKYPASDNTRNTAAWFAARAMRKLDAAEDHLKEALRLNPNQSAYLDTMAEIHFARGHRAKALEWSQIAVIHSPADTLLRRQHERFRSEPLPR